MRANAALTSLIGQAAGAQITITDAHRHAHFHVNGFCLMGVETADGPPGEMDLIVEMVGTSIDPSVLREAATVADALSAIAVNAGNAACAQLEACRKRAPLSASSPNVPPAAATTTTTASTAEPAEPPPSLEALPATVLEQVLCACGSLRAASSLAGTSRALLAVAGSRAAGALALPLDEEPRHWEEAEVTWDEATRTLSRTARPGYGQVVFSQRLDRSALLELEVLRLPPAGLSFGVLQEAPGPHAMKRVEFNSHGSLTYSLCLCLTSYAHASFCACLTYYYNYTTTATITTTTTTTTTTTKYYYYYCLFLRMPPKPKPNPNPDPDPDH